MLDLGFIEKVTRVPIDPVFPYVLREFLLEAVQNNWNYPQGARSGQGNVQKAGVFFAVGAPRSSHRCANLGQINRLVANWCVLISILAAFNEN